MFTPINARMMRMAALMRMPTALSTGDNIDDLSSTLKKMSKPISTMPDGVSVAPVPVAMPPRVRRESMMSVAKRGPLVSSHQKKPVNTVNRKNSA